MPRKPKVSGKFTSAEDLKNTFLKITGPRQEAKKKGDSAFTKDATYWDGGQCQWGGDHNLSKDTQALANFFNSVAGINDEIDNIKLSANEKIFETNKQQLISKIKDCINKCQVTKAYSVANVCCIWNDFFGNFLKKYLDEFNKKLKRQLSAVEKLEPKHQKELLDLETQASAAKRDYEENFRKANDPNLSEQDKAEFIVLANKAAKKAEEIKRKIKYSPIAQASNFNFLDDLKVLSGGNVPPNITPDKKTPSENINLPGANQISIFNTSKDWWQENKQLLTLAGIALALTFYLYSQKETEENYYDY